MGGMALFTNDELVDQQEQDGLLIVTSFPPSK